VVFPSAGLPSIEAGRVSHPTAAEDFRSFAARAYSMGAAVVGGCCGATDEHVSAIAAALGKLSANLLTRPPSPLPPL
jgi:methionine synthase I (cobalamin-dependent)